MHIRHDNRKVYFDEQALFSETILKPYLEKSLELSSESRVCEIGCGEGGNLKPFLDMGCKVTGIDMARNKIENALLFLSDHPYSQNLSLFAVDVNLLTHEQTGFFDLILLRDTLEHLSAREETLLHIQKLLKPMGRVFLAFPPWRMPFGGHQQMCRSRWLGKTPYVHLLPLPLYKFTLKLFGESDEKIKVLTDIRATRISISAFKKIARENSLIIEKEDFYLINPSYQVKFNLKPRILPKLLDIPYLRDFFTTTCYYVVGFNDTRTDD
jgi:SAM-dependent methyltransferase